MDSILQEIEQFQADTDNMVSNIANIDMMLQNAEDDHEEMKKGLEPEEISKLKLFTYNEQKCKGEEDVCSVCLVPVIKGDKLYELDCAHMFHVDCIMPWFKKSTQCPNCRRELRQDQEVNGAAMM